jgi:AcrR family transcriptional regulator
MAGVSNPSPRTSSLEVPRVGRCGSVGVVAKPLESKSSKSDRSRLSVDERRAQLLELGLKLFGERSYDDISIDEIAKVAGVSKGLLYHYFSSKRVFYVEVVRHTAERLLAKTDLPVMEPNLESLRLGLDAFIDYIDENAGPYATFLRSGIGNDPEVAELAESTRRRFVGRMLERMGMETTPPLRIVLRGFVGFVEAAGLDWVEHRDIERDALRELLVATLIGSLLAAGVQPPVS